jgi:hypothetical protein
MPAPGNLPVAGCSVLKDVVAVCRAVGRGEDDVDFQFVADVVAASSFPAWLYVGVACRLFVNLAEHVEGTTVDEILDHISKSTET